MFLPCHHGDVWQSRVILPRSKCPRWSGGYSYCCRVVIVWIKRYIIPILPHISNYPLTPSSIPMRAVVIPSHLFCPSSVVLGSVLACVIDVAKVQATFMLCTNHGIPPFTYSSCSERRRIVARSEPLDEY